MDAGRRTEPVPAGDRSTGGASGVRRGPRLHRGLPPKGGPLWCSVALCGVRWPSMVFGGPLRRGSPPLGATLRVSVSLFVGPPWGGFPWGCRSPPGPAHGNDPVRWGPSPTRCHPCVSRSGREPIALAMIQGARDSGGEDPRSVIIATRRGDRRASADPAGRRPAGRLGPLFGHSSPRVVRHPDHRRRAPRRQGPGHAGLPPGRRRDLRRHGVRGGEIRGIAAGRRINLAFSGAIPDPCRQQIRNIWGVSGWSAAGPSGPRRTA